MLLCREVAHSNLATVRDIEFPLFFFSSFLNYPYQERCDEHSKTTKMKTVSVSFRHLLVTLALFYSSICVYAANYTDLGTTTTYNLNAGDTLFVKSGTYKGYITNFPIGAVIMVDPGAVFQPGNINQPSGKITNYGTTLLSNYGSWPGAFFDNYGILSITGDLFHYDGAVQNWNNHLGANMYITGDFSLQTGNLINEGQISIGGKFNMYSSNSYVKNTGIFTINGTMGMTKGRFQNDHTLNTGELDVYGDIMINSGIIIPKGEMYIGPNTTYTNNCKVNTSMSFRNDGMTLNNGLILTGTSGTSTDEFINTGTFISTPGAAEKSVKFTNTGSITGSGFYYIAGDGYNYGPGKVGVAGFTSDTVIIYDASRNGTNIIDYQWATFYPNVIYRPFAAPNMSASYSGCKIPPPSSPLPVVWKYFYLQSVQNKPELEWSAEYEPNMKFTVERSYDQQSFKSIVSFVSNNTAVYKYIDTTDLQHPTIYYRILACSTDGTRKYSAIKVFKPSVQSSATLYPNPASNHIKFTFTSNQKQTFEVLIINAIGQQIISTSIKAEKGTNVYDFDINNFKPGTYYLNLSNGTNTIAKISFMKL